MNLEPWQWAVAAIGAATAGFAKAGIPGAGMLAAVLFAEIMPARQATGVVLPLLILGDFLAIRLYHAHARWSHLVRLFPWAGAGILIGYVTLGRIDENGTRLLVGVTVLALVATQAGRRLRNRRDATAAAAATVTASAERPVRPAVAASVGVISGFTTLIANAAGPFMSIYLLGMRLPKMEFVGTAAVFFLLINLFKVPFMADLGLINRSSLMLNLVLAPAVCLGVWIGWKILPRLRQQLFETLVLTLAGAAGLDLCLRTLWFMLR